MKLNRHNVVRFQVSPPYDPSGNTALTGANLLYEMLCVLPGVKYQQTVV